jgi:hypothetical protein
MRHTFLVSLAECAHDTTHAGERRVRADGWLDSPLGETHGLFFSSTAKERSYHILFRPWRTPPRHGMKNDKFTEDWRSHREFLVVQMRSPTESRPTTACQHHTESTVRSILWSMDGRLLTIDTFRQQPKS